MRKKDKYRKAIIKIAMQGEEFGVSKTNDIPIDCRFIKCEDCRFYEGDCANILITKRLITAGYRKQSEVIDEFVEKINLIECEMFHKAHDIRNSSEEKLDRCNWKDDLQWGEYKKQEGKMIALQDFMTKIKRIAAEYGVEVEE